jgi:hypothetical protein
MVVTLAGELIVRPQNASDEKKEGGTDEEDERPTDDGCEP